MTKRRTYLAGAAVCVSALVALGTPAVSAAAATTAVTFNLNQWLSQRGSGGRDRRL
jgi:hypothetical protein